MNAKSEESENVIDHEDINSDGYVKVDYKCQQSEKDVDCDRRTYSSSAPIFCNIHNSEDCYKDLVRSRL